VAESHSHQEIILTMKLKKILENPVFGPKRTKNAKPENGYLEREVTS